MNCLAAFIMSVLVLQGSNFKIGYSFGFGWPSMEDEEEYVQTLNESGLDFQLGSTTTEVGLELVANVSERVRLKGSFSGNFFYGEHSETSYSLDDWFAALVTLGLVGVSRSEERMLWVDDISTELGVSAYYVVPGASWLSVGGGPFFSWTSRTFNTIHSKVGASTTALGVHAGVRADQFSGGILGLPIVFGGEVGYRFLDVVLDEEQAGDFNLDFTGPRVSLGTYLRL